MDRIRKHVETEATLRGHIADLSSENLALNRQIKLMDQRMLEMAQQIVQLERKISSSNNSLTATPQE